MRREGACVRGAGCGLTLLLPEGAAGAPASSPTKLSPTRLHTAATTHSSCTCRIVAPESGGLHPPLARVRRKQDAQRLRSTVGSALEQACQPSLPEDERRRILRFVVVGGGATGVEYCGELTDFLLDAVSRLYPQVTGPQSPLAQLPVLTHSLAVDPRASW